MKFTINLSGKTLYTAMRSFGYAPAQAGGKLAESAFQRFLAGRPYPKFHVYCTVSPDAKSATLNLHLDQKRPSYQGSHAHNAEHSGSVVEAEAARIQEKPDFEREKVGL